MRRTLGTIILISTQYLIPLFTSAPLYEVYLCLFRHLCIKTDLQYRISNTKICHVILRLDFLCTETLKLFLFRLYLLFLWTKEMLTVSLCLRHQSTPLLQPTLEGQKVGPLLYVVRQTMNQFLWPLERKFNSKTVS